MIYREERKKERKKERKSLLMFKLNVLVYKQNSVHRSQSMVNSVSILIFIQVMHDQK